MDSNMNTQGDLEQTVIMLEQILEVMPDDLFTLRALYETSLKLAQPEKAFDALTRLDDQSRAAQNSDMIDFVLNQYATIADDSPEVQGRISRLQEIKNVTDLMAEEAIADVPKKTADGESSSATRMDAEMALAWELFQDEQLSQEEYSNVLHDLTEMSANRMGVPVTVLHILHDRQFSRFERLMTHLCQKSSIPVMALSQFEENEEVCRMLPTEFISRNGAMPFAKVGDDLLVGVLNPLDKSLMEEAEALCGRRCHPYLVAPDDYDLQLQKVKQAEAVV
ncbi:GspE/PulE/PilB domain-containing protein [Tichowtungia aerotolerans]|uniref:Type II secretion system protein GspE N-terminal domain-containing protein n=1 Tax=Tichowtungia aerotolerans TaxID=2697043 RepID=A0A6P1MFP4_9BACT|nr:hypothetical protein [Tichowtungia aerotolerans]QHI70838.1 hypothetical protein GT409_15775 [Tichowtungia aerotolerans]